MAYRVWGLSPHVFEPLFQLSEGELERRGARRVRVTKKPSAPCRISLADAEIGEEVLLLSYLHQPADTPYRQQGPIFVREGATQYNATELAPALLVRPLSLRAFDKADMMIDADVVDGAEAGPIIERMFENAAVAYIQAHYAKRGCYAARIERA